MNAKLKKLGELADAATSGPWTTKVDEFHGHPDPDACQVDIMAGAGEDCRRVSVCEPEHSSKGGYDKQPKFNAAYIAAADPANVKRMVEIIRLQGDALETMRRTVNPRLCDFIGETIDRAEAIADEIKVTL